MSNVNARAKAVAVNHVQREYLRFLADGPGGWCWHGYVPPHVRAPLLSRGLIEGNDVTRDGWIKITEKGREAAK